MKLLLLIFLLTGSCTKKNDTIDKVTSIDQLPGSWVWKSTCGGFTGACEYASKERYTVVQFTSGGKYIETRNDTLYQQTNYSLIKLSETSGKLVLDNSGYKSSVSIVNNQLEIVRGDMVDTYEKIK